MSSKFYKKVDNYFKNIKDDIQKKLDITKEYQYNFVEENGLNIIEISIDNKIKLRAEYNIIGLYNIPLSIWYWGYSLEFVNRKLLDKLQIIKEFSKKLEINDKNNNGEFKPVELEELYFITSNNNFYCSSQNIDKIIKIVLYLTKGIWFIPVKHSDKMIGNINNQMDRIEYILINKILQFN